ncbi:hypothetical protein BS78_04G053400 [Paspalum vaginatum]|nr:hypothetical protein BS78_04G053400 [Paspalum vaginatum]
MGGAHAQLRSKLFNRAAVTRLFGAVVLCFALHPWSGNGPRRLSSAEVADAVQGNNMQCRAMAVTSTSMRVAALQTFDDRTLQPCQKSESVSSVVLVV